MKSKTIRTIFLIIAALIVAVLFYATDDKKAFLIILVCVGAAIGIGYIAYSLWMLYLVTSGADEDVNYTRLEKETAKIIYTGETPSRILNNFKEGYYDFDQHSDWVEYPKDVNGDVDEVARKAIMEKNLGELFEATGIAKVGDYPVDQVFKFKENFKQLIEHEVTEAGNASVNKAPEKKIVYSLKEVTNEVKSVKRFYVNAIAILSIEMKDGSYVDIFIIGTYKVKNLFRFLYKIKPDGAIVTLAEASTYAAAQQEVLSFNGGYKEFRDLADKADQNGIFITAIKTKTNAVIDDAFGLELDVVEIRYQLSAESKKLQDALQEKAVKTAEGEGYKAYRDLQTQADTAYLTSLAKEVGQDNAANIMVTQALKDTKIVALGGNALVNVNSKNEED